MTELTKRYISEMELYEKDLPIINNLLNNTSDQLFAKIIEEMALGRLSLLDFDKSGLKLAPGITSNAELGAEITRLTQFRQSIMDKYGVAYDNIIGLGPEQLSNYSEEIDKYKEDYIMSILSTLRSDTDAERAHKMKLLDQLTGSDIELGEFLDAIVLAPDCIYLSRDERNQVLTEADHQFMIDHNLTETEMKKMKALYMRYVE